MSWSTRAAPLAAVARVWAADDAGLGVAANAEHEQVGTLVGVVVGTVPFGADEFGREVHQDRGLTLASVHLTTGVVTIRRAFSAAELQTPKSRRVRQVLWIRTEVPLTTVRALAGHAGLATTDRYARIVRNDLAGAAAQVNSYIFRTRGRHAPTTQIRETRLIRCDAVERTTGIEPAFSAWERDSGSP